MSVLTGRATAHKATISTTESYNLQRDWAFESKVFSERNQRVCGLRRLVAGALVEQRERDLHLRAGKDYVTGNLVRINIDTGEQNPWLALDPTDTVRIYLLWWLDVSPDGRSHTFINYQDLGDVYILNGLV